MLIIEVSGGFVRGTAFECEYIPVPTYSTLFVDVTEEEEIPTQFWTYDYDTKKFSPPKGDVQDPENPEAVARAWNNLRNQRNIFLAESDWTALQDVDLSWREKVQWRKYRQELRDMPQANKDTNPLFLPLPLRPTFIIKPSLYHKLKFFFKRLIRSS